MCYCSNRSFDRYRRYPMICAASPPHHVSRFQTIDPFVNKNTELKLRAFYETLRFCGETNRKIDMLVSFLSRSTDDNVDHMIVPVLSMFTFESCRNKALNVLAKHVNDHALVISEIVLLYQSCTKRKDAVEILLKSM